jgi:hypothetical protein
MAASYTFSFRTLKAKATFLSAFVLCLLSNAFKAQTTYTTTSTNPWSTQVWSPAGTPGPADNVVINHNITGNVAISVSNLTVNPGNTLTLGASNFTVTGTTTISGGSITDNTLGGTDSYIGPVIINAGTIQTTTATAQIYEFSSGIAVNGSGTLNLSAATQSLFKINDQSINGNSASIQLGATTIASDIVLTNNVATANGLVVLGNLNGQNAISKLVNGPNALLQYRGTAVPFATAGSLDAATNVNTVNYSFNGAQGVLGTTYSTLILSTGGTKTANASNLVVQSQLTVNPSITLLLSSGNFTLNGALTLNGTLTDNNASGVNIFNTSVTINSGGTLSSSAVAANFEFHDGINAIGNLSLAAVSVTAFKTNNQTISGSNAIIQMGAVTLANDIIITNNIATANGLILSGNLDGQNAGSAFINGTNALLQYRGIAVPFSTAGTLDANTNANTVNYSGAAQGVLGTNYRTLIIGGSATKTANATGLNVNTALTVNAGIGFTLGSGSLTLNGIATIAGTTTLTSGDFTLNGALTLNGTLTDNNAGGVNIFNTAVTINLGATLSSTAATSHSFEFHNGINAIGTLNLAASSVSTFKTNNQSITGTSGTIQLGSMLMDADIVVTNNVSAANGLVVKGNLDGANSVSEFINAANRLFNYQGIQEPMLTSGSFTVDANPNTVRYSGATQTIANAVYHTIEITAAGTKNMSDLTVNGNYIHTFGTIVSTGTLAFETALAANMQNVGTHTFQEIVVNKPGSTLTLTTGGFTVNNLTVATGSLVFGAAPARTVTVNNNLAGAGNLNMGSSTHILTLIGADNVIGTLTTDGNLSRVNYNRSGDQTIFSSQNYRGLTVGATGLKVLSGMVSVLGNLNMGGAAGCLISLGNNNLKIAAGANVSTAAVGGKG